MELIADILLIAGALGAATYCVVLAAQVDDMTKTLEAARRTAGESTGSLDELTGRAELVAKRLEILVASMHDLPDDSGQNDGDDGVERPPFRTRRAREDAA